MHNYKKKMNPKRPRLPVSKEQLETALNMLKTSHSVRATAKHIGVNESTLRTIIKRNNNTIDSTTNFMPSTSGMQRTLPHREEASLASVIRLRAKCGFGLSRNDIQDIVQSFVKTNSMKDTDLGRHLQKYCNFKDNRPGTDWVTSFMRRWNFSNKLPSALEKTRKVAASDPDIIYGFYNLLKERIDSLNIRDRPGRFWNVDETNLYIDPQNEKIVAPREQKASRVTATSGREAFTIEAAISAAGDVLEPQVLFKGKHVMSAWYNAGYKGTINVTKNGWMTAEAFFGWFQYFVQNVTARPLILVCDGHSSHLHYDTLKLAMDEEIDILKLPPHTTDKLQPLDVVIFKSLKSRWDRNLVRWSTEHHARRVTKADFLGLVAEVWGECFTPERIKKAFDKCGIYPFNPERYPVSEFAPNLLELHHLERTRTLEMQSNPRARTPMKASGGPVTPVTVNSDDLPASSATRVLFLEPEVQQVPSTSLEVSVASTVPASLPVHAPVAMDICLTSPEPAPITSLMPSPVTSLLPVAGPSSHSLNVSSDFESFMVETMLQNSRKYIASTPIEKPKNHRIIKRDAELITQQHFLQSALEKSQKGTKNVSNKPSCSKSLLPAINDAASNSSSSEEDVVYNNSPELSEEVDDPYEEMASNETTAHFLPRRLATINKNLTTEKLYVIGYYSNTKTKLYVGKLKEINRDSNRTLSEFMDQNGNTKFVWKSNPPVEYIEMNQVIVGPLNMLYDHCIIVNGLHKVREQYIKYVKDLVA